MSLLSRIAIRNGDPIRKEAAITALTRLNQSRLTRWHQQLQLEIQEKQLKQPTLSEQQNKKEA
jgi:hypothetical protein